MPKATRDNDSTTPKKRTRKATSDDREWYSSGERKWHSGGAPVDDVARNCSCELRPRPIVEEKIRARAYELYLQRGGYGWFSGAGLVRAMEEICGQQHTA